MNPKIPSKELELKKNKKWIGVDRENGDLIKDPWREVTDLLGKIEPNLKIPASYDFQKLHDRVMAKVDGLAPAWAKKKGS